MRNDIYLTEGGELLKKEVVEGKEYLQNYNWEGTPIKEFDLSKMLLIGNLKDEKVRKFYKNYKQLDIYMKARIDELKKIKSQMEYKKEDWQKLKFIQSHVDCGIETIKETLYKINKNY